MKRISNSFQFSVFSFQVALLFIIVSVISSSCRNGDREFPDNDYTAAYFAYQTPVRTITLGTDYNNDNSRDNRWQCQIMATAGGFYEVRKDIEMNFVVDESLCDVLDFPTPMPSDYYSLSDNKMIIRKGSKPPLGGVTVTLTDAFFADPQSLTNHYVIPLKMTGATGVDRILNGTPAEGVTDPNRLIPDHWDVAPKDYILYAVKYLNQWDAIYLRRGTDHITLDGVSETVQRQGMYSPEEDEVIRLNSLSLASIEFPVNNHKIDNVNLNMTFRLDFNGQNCTFSNGAWKDEQLVDEYIHEYSAGNFLRVSGITVSGSGEYRIDGEKDSWGKKDRDALYLNYTVDYKVELPVGSAPQTVRVETDDVLVLRDRGVAGETFEPVLKP